MEAGQPKLVEYKDLDEQIQQLVQESIKVREKAYCPYSNFKVGAALLSDSGKVYTGCNVENVAYGPTICAERTAIVKAVSTGDRNFRTLVVVADNKANTITTPCGVCRQFISEFSTGRNIQVYCAMPDPTHRVMKTSIAELLPYSFKDF